MMILNCWCWTVLNRVWVKFFPNVYRSNLVHSTTQNHWTRCYIIVRKGYQRRLSTIQFNYSSWWPTYMIMINQSINPFNAIDLLKSGIQPFTLSQDVVLHDILHAHQVQINEVVEVINHCHSNQTFFAVFSIRCASLSFISWVK